MPAIVAGIAVVGSILSSKGKKKQQQKQNEMYQRIAAMYDPANVQRQAAQYNPALYGALRGEQGTTGYQRSLYNIASNPGYIDPSLMNQGYEQSAQRQQGDLAAAQSMLGRNAIGGGTGLGQAYALANQAARSGRDVQLGQQYNLWREQQRRADIDWLSGQQQQALGNAFQGIGQQANWMGQRQAPQNGTQMFGNAVQAGVSAYGGAMGAGMGFGGGGGSAPTQVYQGYQQGQGPMQSYQQSPFDYRNR